MYPIDAFQLSSAYNEIVCIGDYLYSKNTKFAHEQLLESTVRTQDYWLKVVIQNLLFLAKKKLLIFKSKSFC